MKSSINLRNVISLTLAAVLSFACLGAFVGCSNSADNSNSASGNTSDSQTNASTETVSIRIGTMPTEDILPMWVAEQEGLFDSANLDVEIVSFDSASALSSAISAGEVDVAMVDIMRAVKLCESGSPVVLEWVTLGSTAEQGAFGVMAAADAPYDTLEELAAYAEKNPDELADAGVGVAANTVPEYVFDKLCEQAGIAEGAIPTTEVASLPERYSLMTSGQIAAAALPGSMLALGEANGMKLLADDTEGDNISQSVMVAREEFAAAESDAILRLAQVWDSAASLVNTDPTAYIELLAENANLNETIADSYPVSEYPMATSGGSLLHPDSSYIEPQLEWMLEKGYSSSAATYDESTGTLTFDE